MSNKIYLKTLRGAMAGEAAVSKINAAQSHPL
jgi:hypothetical protein